MEERRIAARRRSERPGVRLFHRDSALTTRIAVEAKRPIGISDAPRSARCGKRGKVQFRREYLVDASEHPGVIVFVDVHRGTAGIKAMLRRDHSLTDNLTFPAFEARPVKPPLPRDESAPDASTFLHNREYTVRGSLHTFPPAPRQQSCAYERAVGRPP
jgi:hypothetical protein